MLVVKLDTRFEGARDEVAAGGAMQTEFTRNKDKGFRRYVPQLTALRSDGQKLDMNEEIDVPRLYAEAITERKTFRGCHLPRTGFGFFLERQSKK